ncbi:hypothetical protein GCM10022199_27850 [Marihabitans asiaticum]|uniref:Chromosome partitioning protein n=1 Tax=Marihabitans asiaticum TaxID=415218 RepID=A0A560W6E0_9MICO|nr:AAA family ATPase [Marihabitans asiaticum]TWD13045.1 chromosome partitioning protein [Marihabitans asiaticum]
MTDSPRITPVLAIVSGAGSAGKTTTATTLAALLAQDGQRVLLIDLDPQANATTAVGVDPETVTHTAGTVMLREITLAEAIVSTPIEGLSLVPASDLLDQQRILLGTVTGAEQRLKHALRGVEDLADVVILDCQQGVGELFPVAALVAATAALTTTFPSTKELQGLPRTEGIVTDVADAYNPDLALVAVVPCSVPPVGAGRFYAEAIDALQGAYGGLVTPPVRRSVVASRAYDQRTPLPIGASGEPVTEDYRAVLADLRAKGVLA